MQQQQQDLGVGIHGIDLYVPKKVFSLLLHSHSQSLYDLTCCLVWSGLKALLSITACDRLIWASILYLLVSLSAAYSSLSN